MGAGPELPRKPRPARILLPGDLGTTSRRFRVVSWKTPSPPQVKTHTHRTLLTSSVRCNGSLNPCTRGSSSTGACLFLARRDAQVAQAAGLQCSDALRCIPRDLDNRRSSSVPGTGWDGRGGRARRTCSRGAAGLRSIPSSIITAVLLTLQRLPVLKCTFLRRPKHPTPRALRLRRGYTVVSKTTTTIPKPKRGSTTRITTS